MKFRIFFVILTILGISGSASALTYNFFGEDAPPPKFQHVNSDIAHNAFMAMLTNPLTETFEGFKVNTPASLNLNFGDAGVAVLQGTGFVDNKGTDDRWAVSGTKYWEAQSTNFTVDFDDSRQISAFGFYGTDIGDVSGQLQLRLNYTDLSYDLFTIGTSGIQSGAGLFWGYINTNTNKFFSSAVFSTTSGADHFGFDDMVVGSIRQVDPVPEPATMMLLGSGLAALAGVRLRKRK